MYALVENGAVLFTRTNLPKSWKNTSNFHYADKATQVENGWYELDEVLPTLTPGVNRLGAPQDVIDDQAGTVARTYSVIDLTPEEAETYAANNDLRQVREATKDIVLILTELLPWLVQNTPMQVTDFTPAVRQSYLDLKAVADRVRARG